MDDQIFVSYSRNQLYFAEDTANALQEQGLDIWFDLQQLETGTEWAVEIKTGLEASSRVILIASQAAFQSPYVTSEWMHALELNIRRHHERPRRIPGRNGLHELRPYGGRTAAAGNAPAIFIPHPLSPVKSHPYRRAQIGGKSRKPGIVVIVGGPGFAGGGWFESQTANGPSRPAVDDAGHHIHQLVGDRLVQNPLTGDDMLFQHTSAEVLDPPDPERGVADATRCEGGIGGGHLQSVPVRADQPDGRFLG